MTMTQNKQHKKHPWWKWIFMALGLLAVIVGVPIGINECYKANTGYITRWDAADVLSYYGTLLGSLIAVVVLAATISFTRKQIAYDQFVKKQEQHWNNIDAIITKALEKNEPLKVALITYADIGYEHSAETSGKIQAYIIEAKMSLDTLACHMSHDEYAKIEQLGTGIVDCVNKTESLSNQLVQQLINKQNMDLRNSCEATIRNASPNPSQFEQITLSSCRNFLEDHPFIPLDVITNEIGEITTALVALHNTEYQSLLREKRIAFEKIDAENIANANKLLNWISRRKNDA